MFDNMKTGPKLVILMLLLIGGMFVERAKNSADDNEPQPSMRAELTKTEIF